MKRYFEEINLPPKKHDKRIRLPLLNRDMHNENFLDASHKITEEEAKMIDNANLWDAVQAGGIKNLLKFFNTPNLPEDIEVRAAISEKSNSESILIVRIRVYHGDWYTGSNVRYFFGNPKVQKVFAIGKDYTKK